MAPQSEVTFAVTLKRDSPGFWGLERDNEGWLKAVINEGLNSYSQSKEFSELQIEQIHSEGTEYGD